MNHDIMRLIYYITKGRSFFFTLKLPYRNLDIILRGLFKMTTKHRANIKCLY